MGDGRGDKEPKGAEFPAPGVLFQTPGYCSTSNQIGLFGIETVLIKKHVWPKKKAVLPGALLWDDENNRQYFVTSYELSRIQVSTEPERSSD